MTLLAPTSSAREPVSTPGVPSDDDLKRILSIDFETTCEEDLKAAGADLYTKSDTLVVTVCAWAFDDGPIESVRWPNTKTLPKPVYDHLRLGGKFRAWNAHFEYGVLANHYDLDLEDAQALCTMQQGLHAGLPAALANAGPALGLAIVKDDAARRLMLQMAKLRSWYPKVYWHETDPAKLKALEDYCRQDVAAERAIAKNIPPLPDTERRISLLDRATNNRGVSIDINLVDAMKILVDTEIEALNQECSALTGGAVDKPSSQVAKLTAWLATQGLLIEDLSKARVASWLDHLTDYNENLFGPAARRVLEIRQEIAKSSLKKLDAMGRCMDVFARVRGQLAYYGAFRTGRFAGRQIQPQNFPRPSVKRVDWCVEDILKGCDVDWLRAIYGNPLDAVSSCLRGCLVPAKGKSFVIYDLSQIEARVVAWLAGQLDVLQIFASGQDVYVYAQKSLGLNSRLAGKVVTLALGFQMGAAKFQATAAAAGLVLTLGQAEEIVRAWRAQNVKIVRLWWDADRAAKDVLRAFKGKPIQVDINAKLSITVSRSRSGQPLMTMKLPSGRRLYYRNACLVAGPMGDEIVYDGVDPRTKRWTQIRTYGGKLIENATQATARDVIVEAALRIDDLKLGELVLSAHDELVEEVDEGVAHERAKLIKAEIDRRPVWALDLPVASEGGVKSRYGK